MCCLPCQGEKNERERDWENERALKLVSHCISTSDLRFFYCRQLVCVSSCAVLAHKIDLKSSKGAVRRLMLFYKRLSWPLILTLSFFLSFLHLSLYNESSAAAFQLLIIHSLHSALFWAWFRTQTGWFWLATDCFFFCWLLMHAFPSGASVSVWIFCNSCIWVPQLSSVWNDGSQNHTVIVEKGSNTQKNAGKPNNLWDLKDFYEKQQTVECSGQTRDH